MNRTVLKGLKICFLASVLLFPLIAATILSISSVLSANLFSRWFSYWIYFLLLHGWVLLFFVQLPYYFLFFQNFHFKRFLFWKYCGLYFIVHLMVGLTIEFLPFLSLSSHIIGIDIETILFERNGLLVSAAYLICWSMVNTWFLLRLSGRSMKM